MVLDFILAENIRLLNLLDFSYQGLGLFIKQKISKFNDDKQRISDS